MSIGTPKAHMNAAIMNAMEFDLWARIQRIVVATEPADERNEVFWGMGFEAVTSGALRS
jgi:hypothetical protein